MGNICVYMYISNLMESFSMLRMILHLNTLEFRYF